MPVAFNLVDTGKHYAIYAADASSFALELLDAFTDALNYNNLEFVQMLPTGAMFLVRAKPGNFAPFYPPTIWAVL